MPKQDANASTSSGWTTEQRVNAGQLAAEAMGSPIFNVVHSLLMNKYFREWQTMERTDTRGRERLWDRQAALADFLQEMVSLVSVAQDIVQKQRAENDPNVQEMRRLDEQGYNLNFGEQ